MAAADIPDDLRRFILTSVPSVPYLEAILLLQREHGAAWTASLLARRLYLPEPRAADLLASLQSGGIVAASATGGACTYEPRPELASMLERLAQLYATNLVAVTDLIHSSVDRRAYQFADAFRLRKD
jgi:Mn-dependent DtxR family transcriptional regulator